MPSRDRSAQERIAWGKNRRVENETGEDEGAEKDAGCKDAIGTKKTSPAAKSTALGWLGGGMWQKVETHEGHVWTCRPRLRCTTV